MNTLSKKRINELNELPSSYIHFDISGTLTTIEEQVYWFEEKRIRKWLLKDARHVVEKGESIFGLASLIFIGIETISLYRYGDSRTPSDPRHPSNRFPEFLEKYVDKSFKNKRSGSIDFKDGRPPHVNPTDGQIFYRGMRNSLMHSFSFRRSALVSPQIPFKKWFPKRQILHIDARKLLVKFEDGIEKYFKELWKSKPGDIIYENFMDNFRNQFL